MKEENEEYIKKEEAANEAADKENVTADSQESVKEEGEAENAASSNGTDNNKEEQDPLTAAKEEIEQLKDKYLRSVAEFDNYRKRTLKEKAELILNGSEKAIQAILPVIDDMERAIANGVKKIDTEDADFDTNFHEAVAMVPGMGDEKKGKVLDCVQTGYTLNDKVIRHAKVAVGQ